MKEIQVFHNNAIGKLHCYIDKNNIAFVNIADAAYGLGYTATNRNGVEYIQLDAIKVILRSFGYTKGISAKGYIPENMFYVLAMRADSPAAKAFQLWAANEVFPSLRKKGYYAVENFQEMLQQQNRQTGIIVRNGETSAIKIFIQYAINQGDNRDEGKIYAQFSTLANSVVGIPDGARNTATADQLSKLALVENYIANLLLEGMANNKTYWQIELSVKINVANLARLALYENPLLLK